MSIAYNFFHECVLSNIPNGSFYKAAAGLRSRFNLWKLEGFILKAFILSLFVMIATIGPAQAKIIFCPNVKTYKAKKNNVHSVLKKAFNGMASPRHVSKLAFAMRRMWLMSQGKPKKGIRSKVYRRMFLKAYRKTKAKANMPIVFSQKKSIVVYGLARLKNRPIPRIEQRCLAHNGAPHFRTVARSFMSQFPYNKPCKGIVFTDLKDSVLGVTLHYPFVNFFTKIIVNIEGQKVQILAWTTPSTQDLDNASKDVEFRYQLLLGSKKITKAKRTKAQKTQLVKKYKAFLDKDTAFIKKRVKELKYLLGGYILIPKTKKHPAYFGHIQISELYNKTTQYLVTTPLGLYALKMAHHMNMTHLLKK